MKIKSYDKLNLAQNEAMKLSDEQSGNKNRVQADRKLR